MTQAAPVEPVAPPRHHRAPSAAPVTPSWSPPRRALVLLAAGCGFVFALLAVKVAGLHRALGADVRADAWVRRITERPVLYWLFRRRARTVMDLVLTLSGYLWPLLLAVAGARRLRERGSRRHAVLVVALALGLPVLVELVMKRVIGRTLSGEPAFPSGAATMYWGSAALGMCTYGVLDGRPGARRAACRGGAAATALSFVLLQARWHYPTDVLGGALFGVGVVAAAWALWGATPAGEPTTDAAPGGEAAARAGAGGPAAGQPSDA